MSFKNDYIKIVEKSVKAPSGHNLQPWVFEIEEESISILPDWNKVLPIVDSDNKELYISLGCAWENLVQTASYYGYSAEGTVDNRGAILIRFKKTDIKVTVPLFNEIAKRQTNRNIYNSKKIDKEKINQLTSMELDYGVYNYFWENGTEEFDILKKYIRKGNEIQMNDPEFIKELKSCMRYNKKHSESTKNGLSYKVFGAPNLPKFISQFIMNVFLKADKQNSADIKKIESSSHFVLFTTQKDSIEQWIYLGRSLQRFLLTLSKENIAMAFMNQPCEVEWLKNQLRKELNVEIPAILLRLGYAKNAAYSLRESIEKVISKNIYN